VRVTGCSGTTPEPTVAGRLDFCGSALEVAPERLGLVLVDRGVTERAAQRLGAAAGVEVRRVGWDEPQLDDDGRRVFRPIRHAWRVEVAHGRIGRARWLAKSFENTTASASGWLQVACLMLTLRSQ